VYGNLSVEHGNQMLELEKRAFEDRTDQERWLIDEYKGLKVYQKTPWGPKLLPASYFSDDIAPLHLFRKYAMRYTVLLKPNGLPPLESVTSPEEAGRRCYAISACIASKACGWPDPPTTSEVYDAIRATEPTPRQFAIVQMWGLEAEPVQIFLAWLQRAYSWQVLVESLHRNACHRRGELNEYLNHFAVK